MELHPYTVRKDALPEFFTDVNQMYDALLNKSGATGVLKIVLCTALIALAIVLIIALGKITYTLAMMVLNTSTIVPYDVAEQAVMFFLYFGFIGLIVQYFKSGYHFPLRYFIYAGITAMLRLIIVNHESSVDTILFAGAILIMVIALCLVLYSNKLKNL